MLFIGTGWFFKTLKPFFFYLEGAIWLGVGVDSSGIGEAVGCSSGVSDSSLVLVGVCGLLLLGRFNSRRSLCNSSFLFVLLLGKKKTVKKIFFYMKIKSFDFFY